MWIRFVGADALSARRAAHPKCEALRRDRTALRADRVVGPFKVQWKKNGGANVTLLLPSRRRAGRRGASRGGARRAISRRAEARIAVNGPDLADLRLIAPEADRKARKIGRAHRRGLHARGPEHRRADDVRLRLHQVVVCAGPTVDLEARERDAGIGTHRIQHVVGLVGQRVERGADDVRPVAAARQADDRAARVLIPMGRAKARERRDNGQPFVSVTSCATASDSAAFAISFISSRSHWMAGAGDE